MVLHLSLEKLWLNRNVAPVNNYTPNPVDFDGTNDYLFYDNSIFASDVTTGQAIVSFWFYPRNASNLFIFANRGGSFTEINFAISWTGQKIVLFANEEDLFSFPPTFTTKYQRESNVLALNTWHHVLWGINAGSFDTFYVDGVSQPAAITAASGGFIPTGSSTLAVGANEGESQRFNGGMAEFYHAPGQSLDFSIAVNRQKFDFLKKPADIGVDGATPTGSIPEFYFRQAVPDWDVNQGDGPAFTEAGALTAWTGAEVGYA